MNTPCKECISYAICNVKIRDCIHNAPPRRKSPYSVAYFDVLSDCPQFHDYITDKVKNNPLAKSLVPDAIHESFNIKGDIK